MNYAIQPTQSLANDLRLVSEIERRGEQLQSGPIAKDVSVELANYDASDYHEIQSFDLRKHAAAQIAENMHSSTEYARALESNSPGISREIQDLDSLNRAEMLAKEDFKAADLGFNEPWPTLEGTFPPEMDGQQAQTATAAHGFPSLDIDDADLARLARTREADSAAARTAIGLNSIESDPQRETHVSTPGNRNRVQSDEIFTATQDKMVVPADVERQYLRVGDKFYHSKNTDLVAFEDKGNKLETKSNSEAIAESMVRIAEARGWDEIKVSGSETFRKEVWLEAASRGMYVKGYSPSEQDKAELLKRGSAVDANKVEKDNNPFRARESEADKTPAKPADAPKHEVETAHKRLAQAFAAETAAEAVKKHPELAGAVAAVAAMDKKAAADGLTPEQRAVVAARVRQNVTNCIERGDVPEVKVRQSVERDRPRDAEKEYVR
jgi:hypothetical protein